MLADQHRSVLLRDLAIRANEHTRRAITIRTPMLDNDCGFSVRGPLAHHVGHHIAEPQVLFLWTPNRSFRELEAASELLNMRIRWHERVERRIEPYDAPYAAPHTRCFLCGSGSR